MKIFEVPDELVDEFPKITEKIREKEEELATILNSHGSLKQKSLTMFLMNSRVQMGVPRQRRYCLLLLNSLTIWA
jgi:hypothetical protein